MAKKKVNEEQQAEELAEQPAAEIAEQQAAAKTVIESRIKQHSK